MRLWSLACGDIKKFFSMSLMNDIMGHDIDDSKNEVELVLKKKYKR